MNNLIHVGTLGKPHGIKGAIVVYSKTEPGVLIFDLDLYTKNGKPFLFSGHEVHHKKLVGFPKDIQDRNGAELLRDTALYCEHQAFFERYPQQIFDDLCMGYTVLDKKGAALGSVSSIITISDIEMIIANDAGQILHLPLEVANIDHKAQTISLEYSLDH